MTVFANIAFFAAAQGVFLGLGLIFLKRGGRRANVLLATLILAFSFSIVEFAAYFTEHLYAAPHLLFVSLPLQFLFGPLLFFYAGALHFVDGRWRQWKWTHFVPFLIYSLTSLPFYLKSSEEKIAVLQALQNSLNPPEFSSAFFVWESVKFLHLLSYLLLLAYLVYWQRPESTSANGANLLHRRWIIVLLTGFACYALFDLLHLLQIYFFQYTYLFPLSKLTLFSAGAVIYFLGYRTLRQPEIIGSNGRYQASPPPYQKSSLRQEIAREKTEQLLQIMALEKPYLDDRISLKKLADRLDLSTHHLSEVLNQHLEKTFADFVNEFRVRTAQEMLCDPQLAKETILSIAYRSGFNSKASFNAVFKKHTGKTPSQFRKQHSTTDAD